MIGYPSEQDEAILPTWDYLLCPTENLSKARPGSPKFFFVISAIKIFSLTVKDVSQLIDLEKEESECVNGSENKETKMLTSFMNLFCNNRELCDTPEEN